MFVDELARYHDRILGIQVCDRPAEPRTWMDRKLPGDGDLDLLRILRALQQTEFDGWVELEIFSDDGTVRHRLPGLALEGAAQSSCLRDGRAAFDRLWTEAAAQ